MPRLAKLLKSILKMKYHGLLPAIASSRPFPEQFNRRIVLDDVQDEGDQLFEHGTFLTTSPFKHLSAFNCVVVERGERTPVGTSCGNPYTPGLFRLVLLLQELIGVGLVQVVALLQVMRLNRNPSVRQAAVSQLSGAQNISQPSTRSP